MQALPNTGRAMTGDYGQPMTATLPILTLDNNDSAEFDYSIFLQDQREDIDYLAEESSASTSTPPVLSTSPTSARLSRGPLQAIAPRQQHLPATGTLTPYPYSESVHSKSGTSPEALAQPKQRLERRGHTKSRRGCFNCKRRRIKVSRVPG